MTIKRTGFVFALLSSKVLSEISTPFFLSYPSEHGRDGEGNSPIGINDVMAGGGGGVGTVEVSKKIVQIRSRNFKVYTNTSPPLLRQLLDRRLL